MKYLQVPRFWVALEQISHIPYLPPSLVYLFKMKNFCEEKKKKTKKKSLFSWLLRSDVF